MSSPVEALGAGPDQPATAELHAPTADHEMCVRVVVRDGIPEWWCKACQCWHPIICPNWATDGT